MVFSQGLSVGYCSPTDFRAQQPLLSESTQTSVVTLGLFGCIASCIYGRTQRRWWNPQISTGWDFTHLFFTLRRVNGMHMDLSFAA